MHLADIGGEPSAMPVAADEELPGTPLLSSEPYWTEWYRGVSDLFLYISIL